MNLSQEILEEFSQKIDFGLGRLLQILDRNFEFLRDDYPIIVNYFNGNVDFVSVQHVNNLTSLIEDFNDVSNSIMLNKYRFSTYLDWEICDYLESIKIELIRITKTSKFLRSSATNYNYSGSVEIPYNIPDNSTLEDITRDIQGENDYDNSWIDLAIRNDLSEDEYTLKSYNKIIIPFKVSTRTFNIKSIVDNIIGKKILGLDIKKTITFQGDDLLVLSYEDTALQSVQILASLKKGDVPEFKNFGVSNIVGTSYSSFQLGTLSRELYTVFSSDDSLTRFRVIDIQRNGSITSMRFEVYTRLGEVITQQIQQ